MQVSFIIPYHPSRMDNLLQTLFFLEKREPNLLRQSELVLLCNTEASKFSTSFAETVHIDLHLKDYSRTKMLNLGVNSAKADKIILLDSDRILPISYFSIAIGVLQEGMVISTEKLYNLAHPYTNEEIQRGEVARYPDFRSVTNQMRRKNLFAGNTVMWKKDYLALGGFDEEYLGYGFADTDMTKKAELSLKPFFLEHEELHLWHEKSILWDGKEIPNEHFKVLTAINGMRYCKKWGLSPDTGFSQLLNEIDASQIPINLRPLWDAAMPKLFI